jgi:hypothetical protein
LLSLGRPQPSAWMRGRCRVSDKWPFCCVVLCCARYAVHGHVRLTLWGWNNREERWQEELRCSAAFAGDGGIEQAVFGAPWYFVFAESGDVYWDCCLRIHACFSARIKHMHSPLISLIKYVLLSLTIIYSPSLLLSAPVWRFSV